MARLRDILNQMNTNRSARDVDDEADLLAEFSYSRALNRNAGVVAGTLYLSPDGNSFTIDLGAVDFGPIHWVALADSALEHALKRLTEVPDPPADLMASVMRSRAELDFADDPAEAEQ